MYNVSVRQVLETGARDPGAKSSKFYADLHMQRSPPGLTLALTSCLAQFPNSRQIKSKQRAR